MNLETTINKYHNHHSFLEIIEILIHNAEMLADNTKRSCMLLQTSSRQVLAFGLETLIHINSSNEKHERFVAS